MSDWMEQYSAALQERDAREHAHKSYVDAFTKLADRTHRSRAQLSGAAELPAPAVTSQPASTRGKAPSTEAESPPNDLISSLRADLGTTQKARSALQSQVDELTTSLSALSAQNKASTKQITQLTRQKTEVERRLRDREEEIRGKTELVTQAQDEMVALSLQLNMAEQTAEKLKNDNKELLDRWMTFKRDEADRMNRDSKWE